ncbi:MAG: T9SS type A sorting domain-containing protein [Candidatus Marinimicrobia bacterium]|nr:T9SS type A sorting domain-containing protein [FCB group bacterium]MBL7024664.1 T9SS type A sorting domain-containing protein [Candidatus Neomarinimicrobiota bacterium]
MKKIKTLVLLLTMSSLLQANDPEIVTFTTVDGLIDGYGGSLFHPNADGSMVAGRYYWGGGFIWTEDEGVEHIGGYSIRGMDRNGYVAGEMAFPMMMGDTITDVEAACYWDGEDWVMIGPIQGTQPFDILHYQGAWAIAADTMIIAGMYWHEENYRTTAFIWTPEDPDGEFLEDYGLDQSSRPNDISADGSVIAGFASQGDPGVNFVSRSAHAWIRDDATGEYEFTFLGAYNPDVSAEGEAYCVSPNGEYISGWSWGAMFIWTEEDGFQIIGYHPDHDPSTAKVTTMDINDQQTAVGFAAAVAWEAGREATIYTLESGIVFLKDSLESLGLEDEIEDWYFYQANGISDDGQVVVGSAIGPSGFLTPFIVKFIPPTAPYNLSSQVLNDEDGERIELFWDDEPTNNEYTYHLQRRMTNADSTSNWSTLAYPDSSQSEYVDTDIYLANGVEWEYRLRAENPVGESEWVEIMTASSTEDIASGLPTELRISSAFPNPFNPTTTIQYGIPEQMQTKIALYSITGTELAVLHAGQHSPGNHNLQLDMSGYSSGLYLVQIINGDKMDVQKITLIK